MDGDPSPLPASANDRPQRAPSLGAASPSAPTLPPGATLPGATPAVPARPDPSPVPTVPAGRITVALAGLALACFAVAAVLLALPVSVPGVQDCGAPGAYLAQGRVDVVPDANDRILGPDGEIVTLDGPTAAAARDHPCQERVAARAVPAGVLLVAGTLIGLAAFALEVLVVRPRRRRAWRVAAGMSPPSPTSAGPQPG